MHNKTKHIKHIRIYHARYSDFIKLKNEHFFSYMSFDNNKYKELLIEFLIEVLKSLHHTDTYNYQEFEELISEIFILVEAYNEDELPSYMKKDIINELFYIFSHKQLPEFKGKVLELLMVYIEKNNNNKIYHEPYFYHKRKRLFKNEFSGSNCLIDVVTLTNNKDSIQLIECKANLDNHIKKIFTKKENSFKAKIRMMDRLEDELSKYKNHSDENVVIKKFLASVKVPLKRLPKRYSGYHYINLSDHIKLKKPLLNIY